MAVASEHTRLDAVARAASSSLHLAQSILAEDLFDWPVHDPQVREDALSGVDALLHQLGLLKAADPEDLALMAALHRWLECGDHFRQRGDEEAAEPILLPALDVGLDHEEPGR